MENQQTYWAFFDFDDTLLAGDSILFWRQFYYKRRPYMRIFQILDWLAILLNSLRLISTPKLKQIFFLPTSYEKSAALHKLGEDFILQEIAPRLHLESLNLVFAHAKLGHRLVIISASSQFYLQFLKLILPPCEIVGTEWEWPRSGLWRLPTYKFPGNMKGESKIIYIKSNSKFPQNGKTCFAYSDHIVDRFLLAYARFPMAVGPEERLRRWAREADWPVLELEGLKPAWELRVRKLALLLFAPPFSPPGASASNAVRKNWQRTDYFPLRYYACLKNRVEQSFPEKSHAALHQEIFGNFPDHSQLVKLCRAQGLSWESSHSIPPHLQLIREEGSWIVQSLNAKG